MKDLQYLWKYLKPKQELQSDVQIVKSIQLGTL